MTVTRSRLVLLLAFAVAASAAVLVANGCSSDSGNSSGSPSADAASGDASTSEGSTSDATNLPDAASVDANCPKPKVLAATGQTCVGFGAGSPCDPGCGLPAYGYVCFNGGPPGFTGCVQASSTGSFGDTYCCPKNDCVAQPDQDTMCGAAGKPHRFQCPPDGAGNAVSPPAGCGDGGAGATALEKFYCCP